MDAVLELGRAHRALVDALTYELRAGAHKVSPAQAMILYQMGDRELSYTQVSTLYAGTNASHNVGRMVDARLLTRRRPEYDMRLSLLKRTPDGAEIAAFVAKIFAGQSDIAQRLMAIKPTTLAALISGLRDMQKMWEPNTIVRAR